MAALAKVSATQDPEGVRFLDHTADFGLEVEAPSLEACFARAAAGVFSSFVHADALPSDADRVFEIDLEANSLEELMVAWLEELLYRSEVEGLFLYAFQVDAVEGMRLRARVSGRPADPQEKPGETPVKGVTRHQLSVRRDGNLWHARIIFDV